MTTGHSGETQDCLTKEPIALSSYALTYVALNQYRCLSKNELIPFVRASAVRSSGKNCSPAPDLVLWKPHLPMRRTPNPPTNIIHSKIA